MGFGSRFAGRDAEDGGEVSEGDGGHRGLEIPLLSRMGGQLGGRGSLERQTCGERWGDAGGQPLPGNPEARTDEGRRPFSWGRCLAGEVRGPWVWWMRPGQQAWLLIWALRLGSGCRPEQSRQWDAESGFRT